MGKNNLNWEARFQELADYKRVQGDCNVPRHKKANKQLGTWVNTQRTKKETMSEHKRNKLNSICFTWKLGETWEVRFQELVEYKRFHGDCNVPHTHKYKAYSQLGRWVMKQRVNKETMREELRKRLDSIGFVWKLRATPISVLWEVRFQQLLDYKRVHGNCNAPREYNANPQLGTWVNSQRTKEETMSEERREKLNSVGFTWKVREAHILVDWEIRFQQLVEYKRVHGDCNVPQSYNTNPQLGTWVTTQRTKKKTISGERRKQLDSIGFTWCLRTHDCWEARFQQLVEYKRVYGNCNVPIKYNANQLGNWVQRQRHKKETMSEHRRNQLDSIGFVWRLRAPNKRLQARRPSMVEDPKKKKARLDEEAAQEDTFYGQQGWDSYFEQLREFVRKYNNCNIPAQHPELGRWAEEQRQLYERKQIGRGRESNLTDEQEAKLMAVGFFCVRTLNIPDDDDIYSI